MRNFATLLIVMFAAFALTLGLDIYQRKLAQPGKQTILFASMWAPGEPMQAAYDQIFQNFEKEFPQYHVEARFDGRWVVSAVRPRFLTNSDIPDILNDERNATLIVVQEGYAVRLDEILEQEAHPDGDAGKKFKDAFNPMPLKMAVVAPANPDEAGKFQAGIYIIPSGVWTTFFFYNKLHYQALGLTPPRTWTQFIANCEKLKANGYAPLAADQDNYAITWSDLFLRRAVPEETLRASILNHGPAFNTDPRYRAAFAAIQEQHNREWMMPGWEGSLWPSAQRHWVEGRATHMICGTWLIRETLTYEPDPAKFQMGAFMIPELDTVDWGGQPPLPMPDQKGVDASITGHVLLKGGRNRAGAIELLRYLARRDSARILAQIGKEIPPIIGADYPPELQDIRADFTGAKTVFGETALAYAPKWNQFVFKDLYHDLFMGNLRKQPIEDFLNALQAKTDNYHDKGSEQGIH